MTHIIQIQLFAASRVAKKKVDKVEDEYKATTIVNDPTTARDTDTSFRAPFAFWPKYLFSHVSPISEHEESLT